MWAFSKFNFSSCFSREAIDFFSSLSFFPKSLIVVFYNYWAWVEWVERLKTRGGGNRSSGEMGLSAGMGFCG